MRAVEVDRYAVSRYCYQDFHFHESEAVRWKTGKGTGERERDSGRELELRLCHQPTLALGHCFVHRYECKRVFATAADQTQIPISIVYRRDLYVVHAS